MQGNGFCWGQLSHTLAWIYQMTSLTPSKVHAFLGMSENTGADVTASINILCTNGANISISGLGVAPMESCLKVRMCVYVCLTGNSQGL